MLIRDRTIIIHDNTIRRAKIARGFELMNRVSELLACNAELVANVLGWIFPPIPNDASHAQAYSARADQSLSGCDSRATIRLSKRRQKGVAIQPSRPEGLFTIQPKHYSSGRGRSERKVDSLCVTVPQKNSIAKIALFAR